MLSLIWEINENPINISFHFPWFGVFLCWMCSCSVSFSVSSGKALVWVAFDSGLGATCTSSGRALSGGRNDHRDQLDPELRKHQAVLWVPVYLGVINSQRISIQIWSSWATSALFPVTQSSLCVPTNPTIAIRVYVCVHVVYMYACLHVYVYGMCISQMYGSCTCMCVHMYMEVRGQCLLPFSVTLHLTFWRRSQQTWNRPIRPCQQIPRISLSLSRAGVKGTRCST